MGTYRGTPKFLSFALHEQMAVQRARDLLTRPSLETKHSRTVSEKSVTSHRVVHAAWFVICSVGLVVHSWLTTNTYLQYNTFTEVQVYTPVSFRPPAVSLCFVLSDVMNVSKLDAADQGIWLENGCKQHISGPCLELLHRYGVERVINELTFDFTYKKRFREDEVTTNQTIYYKKRMKCVRYAVDMSQSEDGTLDVGEVDEMSATRISFLVIELPPQGNVSGAQVALFVHDSDSFSHIRDGNLVWITIDNNNYHVTGFDHIESHYLPKPFWTACNRYSETPYKSKGECLELCYDEKYRKMTNLDPGLVTSSNLSLVKLPSKSKMRYDRSIDRKCSERCKRKCRSLTYYSVTIGDYLIPKINPIFYHDVTLSRPFTKVRHIPSFDTNQYVIFIASAAGMWLGSSLYVSITNFVITIKNMKLAKYFT